MSGLSAASLALWSVLAAAAPADAQGASPSSPGLQAGAGESSEGAPAGGESAGGEAPEPGAEGQAPEEGAPAVDDPSEPSIGLKLVPKITINSDDGFGLGVRGTGYWYRWGQKPYKTALYFQAWMTTRLVQHHYLKLDAIDAFNLPLRVEIEVGYFQSRSQNFCGFGNRVSCDPLVAEEAVRAQTTRPLDVASQVPNYYKVRFHRPYTMANLRMRVLSVPVKTEVFGGWRGFFYWPGDFFDADRDGWPDLYPFPGSLYATRFPDGEKGLASVVQAGFMIDTRDNEPAPRRGIWAEASVRAANPLWFSRWAYGGGNVTVRGYLPLLPDETLVLATRAVGDLLIGDPPLQEMIRVGGSNDYIAFGGLDMGRGIRVQRHPGRVKVLVQQELRYELPTFEVWAQRIRFGLAGFYDAGYVAEDLGSALSQPPRVAFGFGISGRVAWNDNFVMRLDVAISADEAWRPQIYSAPGHPF